jgi:hypothetical protein
MILAPFPVSTYLALTLLSIVATGTIFTTIPILNAASYGFHAYRISTMALPLITSCYRYIAITDLRRLMETVIPNGITYILPLY